jgi:hypothetical protein
MASYKLTRYCDVRSYRDRRIMDARFYRRVKYNDGFRELGASIKAKVKEIIAYLKKIGVGGVIIRLLGALAVAVAATIGAKKGFEALKNTEKVKKLTGEIENWKATNKPIFEDLGAKGVLLSNGINACTALAKAFGESINKEIAAKEEKELQAKKASAAESSAMYNMAKQGNFNPTGKYKYK